MRTQHLNLILFGVSIVITLALHYFLFSKVIMHTTTHVFLGIIILFVILGIFTVIFNAKKSQKKK